MSRSSTLLALLAALSLIVTACNGDDDENTTQPDAGHTDVDHHNVDPGDDVGEPEPDVVAPDHPDHRTNDCDPLIEGYCSMPWPSNLYLEHDAERMTGYTLDFGETSLPRNIQGNYIDPTPYRHLDGYGLGTPVVTLLPGVDISSMPHEEDIAASVEDDDRQALYFKVTDDGLEAVPFWAELDVHTDVADEQVLYLRPAVILEENTRYIVAFRNLETTDGDPIERSPAFDAYLTGDAVFEEELAWRQERFDEIFDLLDGAGIDRDELTLAWDFHTGSTEGLHSDLLHVIERGLAYADDEGIPLEITSVTANTPDEHAYIAYEISGFFTVPHFLEESDRSHHLSYLLVRDEDGIPTITGTRDAQFWLQIPHTAVDGTPHGLVKYGHGMLGRGNQVTGGFNSKMAFENELIFFAASFTGFSTEDVPQAIEALGDPTQFEEISDRMHQGVLEYALLTRAMRDQLHELPNLDLLEDEEDLELAVDEDRIYYSGISQGGIYGVTYVAVDPLITRGHFGVPGHNYSTLMERSSNFYGGASIGYSDVIANSFSDRVDQSMVIPVIQLLWDKIDPVSYMRRLTAEPFYDDIVNYGHFGVAKADYQVAVVTKEITARSGIDIPILENYDRERGEPWGVDVATYPHSGSGVILYDFDNPWPAPGNIDPKDDLGDPHGLPRRLDEHNDQIIQFWDDEVIVDVCGGEPCHFPRE